MQYIVRVWKALPAQLKTFFDQLEEIDRKRTEDEQFIFNEWAKLNP
jgi:hypothetical protein